MNFEIEITKQADLDIRGIFEYITFKLFAPENALGQLDRIEAAIMSLDQMPERFRKYHNKFWLSRDLHLMPVDNYVVLYTLDNEKKLVTVLRVMYGGRDIENKQIT